MKNAELQPVVDPLQAVAALATEHGSAWVVGGAVRDAILGRDKPDLDLAVTGDPGSLAAELARKTDGFRFKLSEDWGAWRVSARDRSWQVDITPLADDSIELDLARRDLTINAIAQPLAPGVVLGSGDMIDPHGGLEDLRAHRLRAVGQQSFTADPLRVMRLARLAAALGFDAEPVTVQMARASAAALPDVAPERVFAELRHLLCSERAVGGLEAMRELGATAAVLPELEALGGIEQSPFHHLDVYRHTLATLQEVIDLEREPEKVFGEHADGVARVLSEPLANEMTRGQALRFGALMHDIAKSRTREVAPEGRITFFHHDTQGAEMAVEILRRLHASERLAMDVAALTRHHLRLGFLVHERPLTLRAIYRYLAACESVEVDVTALSVADRLATLGRNSERSVALHLELARELMPRALSWHQQPPRPPIRGDRLAASLGIEPGPELGKLLAELTEAAYAGEVSDEQQAVEYGRRRLIDG